jgi:hypothetical protein
LICRCAAQLKLRNQVAAGVSLNGQFLPLDITVMRPFERRFHIKQLTPAIRLIAFRSGLCVHATVVESASFRAVNRCMQALSASPDFAA